MIASGKLPELPERQPESDRARVDRADNPWRKEHIEESHPSAAVSASGSGPATSCRARPAAMRAAL